MNKAPGHKVLLIMRYLLWSFPKGAFRHKIPVTTISPALCWVMPLRLVVFVTHLCLELSKRIRKVIINLLQTFGTQVWPIRGDRS